MTHSPSRRNVLGGAGLAGLVIANPTLAARPPEGLRISGLMTENVVDPLGVQLSNVRLSWRLETATRGTMQSAYQIQVASSAAQSESGHLRSLGQREDRRRPILRRRLSGQAARLPPARPLAGDGMGQSRADRCQRSRFLGNGSAVARRLDGQMARRRRRGDARGPRGRPELGRRAKGRKATSHASSASILRWTRMPR